MEFDSEELLEAVDEIASALGDRPLEDVPERCSGLQVWDDSTKAWLPVKRELWRSWTGFRAVWGVDYHGPIYSVDTKSDDRPWAGPRTCICPTCQEHVSPQHKAN